MALSIFRFHVIINQSPRVPKAQKASKSDQINPKKSPKRKLGLKIPNLLQITLKLPFSILNSKSFELSNLQTSLLSTCMDFNFD